MSEFVSPEYQQRLDQLAERLMTERFIRSLGDEAIEQFIQPELFEDVE